ncbi:unnamed protein product [Phytophthora lilii]|uniref:Unnamed protein product n=1 Tax=Phytophthora lilii TaxID=2077276 RepID=A0A9W6TBA6_9STRA|nr:unnamed protein product [Phytophthora lilii]
MRTTYFLLVFIAVVACFDCFASADVAIQDDAIQISSRSAFTNNRDTTTRFLKEPNPADEGENDTANTDGEARSSPSLTKLETLLRSKPDLTKLKTVEGVQDDLAKLTKSKSLNGKLSKLKSLQGKHGNLNKLKTFDGKKFNLNSLKSQLEKKPDASKLKALVKEDPDLRSVKHLVGKRSTKLTDGELKACDPLCPSTLMMVSPLLTNCLALLWRRL